MRLIILTALMAVAVVLGISSTVSATMHKVDAGVASATLRVAQDPPKLDVNVNVNKGGGGQWYTNPLWLAIGGLGLVVLVVLVVMASKGGGTTVVKG